MPQSDVTYEYQTASFLLSINRDGTPLEAVDAHIAGMQRGGWEYLELTSSATNVALSVVVVYKRLLA